MLNTQVNGNSNKSIGEFNPMASRSDIGALVVSAFTWLLLIEC